MEQALPSWALLLAVLAPVLTGLVTMLLPRKVITLRVLLALAGPVIAAWLIFNHLAQQAPADAMATSVITWIPNVNLNLSFLADGLGTFFALLVAGIGALIVLYARGYFGPDKDSLFRFYPTLGFFTTAMLGIVLSDNLLSMVMFWELTSISSFLLIGWDRYDKKAVKLAMQAFFTTGLGGMGLFGGVLMFGMETDLWRWSDIAANGFDVTPMVVFAFVLMFFGAATKSAQWPWHYWLPGAMAAPTPVSAYLHSATMVKAGVYLIARMYPMFHGLEVWPWLVATFGAITMLLGAIIALNQHDLKRIFAYTTVSQLGLLMCAYGLGALEFAHGGHHLNALDWDISQIANHAFYKAPLFIIAGAIGHVAGTRNLPELFGFWKKNKPMVIVMVLAAYALAGGPGTISFPAKELFFYAIYHAFEVHWIFKVLAVMAVMTAMCNVAIFVRLTTTLFGLKFGMKAAHAPHTEHGHEEHHHEGGLWGAMIWIPGAALVLCQYVGGLYPAAWNHVFGLLETNMNYEAFAHGLPNFWEMHWGVPLMMSLIAFTGGITIGLSPFFRGAIVDVHDRVYPGLYWLAVTGGGQAFRVIQRGSFRQYVTFILTSLLVGFAAGVYLDPGMLEWPDTNVFEFWPGLLLGLIICATALMLPMVQVRVVRVLVLGSCGFSVVGMYLIYQAPDLALTQLMFEIISVILFVLVLRLLPEPDTKKRPSRWWRMGLAGGVGLAIGWITLIAANSGTPATLGEFFIAHSYEGSEFTQGRGGGGANIVNVILVDFRGFDTIGEITVLSIAALGVWSLLPGRKARSLAAAEANAAKQEERAS